MTLAAHLQDQQARLERLLALLADERVLLNAGEVDGQALAQLAEQKQQELTTLAELEQRRRAALETLGYGNHTAADIQAARDQNCLPEWQRLRARAGQAARQNRLNGELINLRMAGNQRLLNELHALAGKDLYGPDGQAQGKAARLSSSA